MTGDGPPQLHFDPKSGAVPDEVGPGGFPQVAGGGVVTLFVTANADREWAGRTAIELARTWGDSGQRVFLGDLCFHSPILHDLLDEPASPNLADVILRQVRIEDVVRSVVAGSFLFAPACPADAEAPQIADDVGWEGFIAGFAEVGATVFFFADEHVPGLGRILEASSKVFVLSAPGAVHMPPGVAARVRAVLQPPTSGPAHRAADPSVDAHGPAEAPPPPAAPWSEGLEELVVEDPSVGRPSLAPGGPSLTDLDEPVAHQPLNLDTEPDQAALGSWREEPAEPTPPPGEEVPPREWEAHLEDDAGDPVTEVVSSGGSDGSAPGAWARRMLPGVVIIILGLVTISIAWPDAEDSAPAASNVTPPARSAPEGAAPADNEPVSEEAGGERTPTPTRPALVEVVAPVESGGESSEDRTLGYSLTLASYRDAGAARRRAEALGRLRPRVPFIVAPVRVDGTTYHRLLAFAGGVDEARALRDTIGSVSTGDEPSRWIVRRTPLAFELAVVSDLEEARAHVARAELQEINAYVVVQNGVDRPTYSVLAGAYRGEDEAARMRELLADAGFPDAGLKSLVGRVVR